MAANGNWYYAKDGQQLGPVSSADLKQLAASGGLSPSDLIWKEEWPEWKVAGTVKEMFGADRPVIPVPPPLSHPSANPPAASTPPSTASNVAGTMQAGLTDIMSTAKHAKDLAATHARRTQITQMTLPKAYLALGKDVFVGERFREEFSDLFQRINTANDEITKVATTAKERPQATDLKGKLQSGAAQLMAQGQTTKLGYQRESLVRELGKKAFESHGTSAGSPELVSPITSAKEEIARLDEQIAGLSSGKQGSIWQRLPIAALLTVFCWPVGMLLVWLNPILSRRSKWVWTGVSIAAFFALWVAVPRPETTVSSADSSPKALADASTTAPSSIPKSFSGTGPNGEKVLKGDNDDKWGYWHYYIDKNEKEVMHGPGRGRECCPIAVSEYEYEHGVLKSKQLYDEKGNLLESFTRMNDGNYQRDDHNNGDHWRSTVSITKVDGRTEIRTLTDKEQVVSQQERNTPPPAITGEEIAARIATAGGDHINEGYNRTLKDLHFYAQDNQVALVFRVDATAWRKLGGNWTLPLRIRLFDGDGGYITHFDTVEVFTPLNDTYEQFQPHYEDAKTLLELGGLRTDKIHKPVLLQSNWNTITYPLNNRHLRDAAVVEVGFLDHAHPGTGGL